MAKVYFKRKTTQEIEELPVEDGSLIYNTDNGKTYMDFGEDRIQTGGNADTMIAIGGEEPTDEDIKIWFPDDTIKTKASEVINSMDGNETDLAPSVNAVKSYINNLPSIILCTKSETYTTTNSYTDINDWQEDTNIGNCFSISDGKVLVGDNVNHIKVSVTMNFSNGANSKTSFTYIRKNSTNVKNSWKFNTMAGKDDVLYSETVISVTKGDIITASVYGDGQTLEKERTTLIVEKIN